MSNNIDTTGLYKIITKVKSIDDINIRLNKRINKDLFCLGIRSRDINESIYFDKTNILALANAILDTINKNKEQAEA